MPSCCQAVTAHALTCLAHARNCAQVQSYDDNAARWIFVVMSAGYGQQGTEPFELHVDESCNGGTYSYSLMI